MTPFSGVAVSFAAAAASVTEGESVTVTLTLAEAPAAGTSVTVPIVATRGAGLDSGEYSGVPTQVTFSGDETSMSFTVTTVEDTADEPNAVLTLAFGMLPAGYIVGTHAELALTVVDDDHPIVAASFGTATASVVEGGSVEVTVTLTSEPEREVVLPLVATRGANLAADEVEGVPASVTVAADETEARFTVTFADDAVEEGNETLTLDFGTRPADVTSGANPQLVLTVTDDDGPPAAPDVSAQTGDGYVTLSWTAVSNDSPVLRYEVRWRETDGGTFGTPLDVGLVTRYRVEGLTNGTAYEFQVHAVNAHGEGEAASAPGTPTARLTGIPNAPQVLQVKATDSGRAELNWTRPANATDKVTRNSATAPFSQIQGYRIEVCRTTCDEEANWYAVVPNTRAFEHKYVHQVLAPGVIRENHYRVQAININGKTGPWSNVATLEPTVVESFRLQTPDDSTLWLRFRVLNPDGNKLYVRYENTGTGAVAYTERRLTKKGDVTLVLSGLEAGSWYRVDIDFSPDFDSSRMQSRWYGTARAGETPLRSPYAVDALDAQVFAGGVWRDAPDRQLYVRMGGTGKYRVRLKPCSGYHDVVVRRIQAPAGRLRASAMDADPVLMTNLRCKEVRTGWEVDENGDFVLDQLGRKIGIWESRTNDWQEVTVTALALEDYPADRRYDALLSAPFAVVYNHEVWREVTTTRSSLVSEGTGLVRVSLDRPADATLPEPTGVAIADPVAGGFGNPVMRWDAVSGATGYLVEWRHGVHYSDRANQDRSLQTATSVTLPLGASRRGPITARVRAYSRSGVSGWVERTWDTRPPTFNVFDAAVNEADGSVGFLVTLSPAASGTVTVDYATVDGTAVAGTDYTATSGTLTFAPGEREKKTALVPIADDGEEDSGETFRLVLSNPAGRDANNGAAVLGDAEAVATILNSEREAAALTGFTLVDAGTNGDLMVLAEGSTVRLGALLAPSYGIRAEMGPGAAPGSVRLELTGVKTVTRIDDAAPWSLYGDGAGRVNGAGLPPGSYTLTATAYADSEGRGEERGSLEVSFTVTAGALGVTTPGPFRVAEGTTAVTVLGASQTGTGESVSWSIPEGTAGGADGAAFTLDPDGVLALRAAKDFEAPDDADGDGTWAVTVEVRAGAQSATASLLVTLADANEAPVAKATADLSVVREGAAVTLDAGASTDPDAGDRLSYAWTQTDEGGPRVTLSDASAAQPVFTAPSDLAAETELAFTLRATDAGGLYAEDTVTVTVSLISEVAIAAASDYAAEGADAVFRLTRQGSALKALTVPVSVEESGAMLGSAVPESATFAAGAREAEFRVPTAADAVQETDSRVTARLASGGGWQLAPGAVSASLTVLDDDVAPVNVAAAADVTVWSADMTVVEYGPRAIGAGSADLFSNQMGRAGLRAKWLWYDPPARKLRLGFDDGLDDAQALTLHVGGVSLGFPDNTGGNSSFSLENVDIAWTDGETVAARVSKPSAAAVSTDATLASLAVGGAALSPAFDAGVLVYRAVADAGVETVTVTASANGGGAAVTWGPADDADTALADYQVAVPEGEALVEVTVTAADGTVRRYRVVVARAKDGVNTAPTGLPAISGTAEVGEELTVSADDIADGDGLENVTFVYQWLANDGTDDTEIEGATGGTHEVAPTEVGKTLKVRVTFTDDGGTEETLKSVATEPVAARAPDAPGGLTVAAAAGRAGELDVSWTAPASDGGSEVTGYKVQWKSGAESYDGSDTSTRQALVSDPAVLTHTITGLTVGTAYTVRVLAANAAGDGAAVEVEATVQDRVHPTLTAASVNGTALTLTFSEALDADSKPAADAFTVTVAGNVRAVGAVVVSGSAVELTLASAVASGETVTVGYTAPTGANASPLKDAAGNAVVGFTGEAVTNDTPAAGNTAPTGLPEISGTAEVGEVLTVSVAGIADADDIDAETFAYQWLANAGTDDTEIAGATSKTYTVAPADAGKTLKVRVTYTDGGGTEEVLTSAATESVPVPLTAQFRGVPESHDGSSEFSFEVLFSEPVRVSYVVLKQQSFEVTGGTVEKAKRARDGNGVVRHDLREIHIQPNTQGDVTVVLAGGRACGTTGAICTADEKVLSSTLRLTVPGPASTELPAVSIAGGASPVTEGAEAAFTLTRTGDATAALTVTVGVTATGAMLAGEAPTEVTFEAESATATLALVTEDDEVVEDESAMSAIILPGNGYTVAAQSESATVMVSDDDAAPVVTTALALAVAENATAVATLEATDADTESLAWSIAGGADAGAFTVSEAGALAFKASKDFEAPDDADGDGSYEVTMRVTDGANPVDVALTVGLTDVDEIAPVLTAASVNGTTLMLTFSEALDSASKPTAGAIAVTVAGDARTVDAVALSGSAVELTLASAVASGETVTVGYTVPAGANAAPLKDAAGNPVAGFTGEGVTNGTPAPENTAPTGLPEISGTPQVRETLTASESAVEDADGLDNAIFAWQWLSNDGTQDTEIAAATAATYTPVPGDVGKTLKVRVTFSDDAGNAETLTSAATAAVLANVPEAPRDPAAATADGREQELTVSWTAPASDGGAAITGYRVQWKSGSEDYDATASSTRQAVVTGLTHTIAGLTDGVSYTVRIVAVNDAGDGAAAEVSAEPRDRVVPVLSKAAVDGVTLTLTYGEALDEDSAPGAEAFAVTVADATRTVDAVAVSGSAAVLTLASAVASGQTVTVDYTPPTGATANPLQDAAGNAAAGFTGEAVSNETAAPANTAPTGLPAISGTAQVGETLTASASAIEDADGLENATFVWQWLSNDGTEGAEDVEIEAATAATYQPVPGDIGKTLMVRVTFSDDAENEEMLVSAATEAVIAAPVKVSIAAASSPVTEGRDAVFTLTRTGDTAAALTVGVSVSAAGAFLDGAAPTEASFAQGASTATLRVATTDDGTAEADGRVSASVSSGTGYAVADGAGGAGVDVLDNDKAAPALTVLWSATMTVADYGTGAIGAGSADLLTDQSGSAGLNGKSLWYYAPARKLRLGFTEAIPEGDGLTLHLGSRALALPEGSAGNPGTAWEGIDVAWSDGETIAVRLTAEAAAQVPAGPGISVADARVQEAAGAELSFRVTLDAAQSSAVSVRYATSDGTAVAGADYVAASGAVRFAPGQTSKTVRVLVLEDAHDDSGETLALTLSSPFGAQLSDGQATGTIINTDPVPKAWLARFGRTVAGHVVDAISGRFEGSAGGGSHVTLGGQRLSLDGDASSGPGGAAGETSEDDAAARDGLAALAKRIGSGADRGARTSWEESGSGDGWMRERGEDGTRSMTGSELLLGSSFHLSLGNDEEGARAADTRWTAWGRASSSRFDGDADGLSVDGEVTTFTLGADAAWARWLAGVAVSLSEGEGGFRDHPGADDESRGTGALESTLTSVHPYARLAVNERLSVWGILGYGTGELTLEVEDKESWTTDTAMEMAAAGARGVLVPAGEAGGFELSVRTDAQLVRMTSEAARGSDGGNLAATQSDTSRLRVMLEGSRAFALEGGGALTPSLEAGLRHDAGDAETGTGIEIGGGLSYTDPATGITVEGKARGLVAHEDTDYSEWGASGSVRIDPGAAGRGLALSLSPAWGADSGGAERLWSARDARALAANDAFEPGGRLEAEAGYGLGAFGGRGLMTPFAGLSLSDAGNRTWRSGVRWTLGPDMAFGVEGALREAANDDAAEHEIGFRLKARF